MAHTPGPWKLDIDLNATFDNDGRTESLIEITTHDHSATVGYAYDEDNGQVLVAAPDLLAALQDAEFLLRKMSINWKEAASMVDSAKRSADDARAAIAKATR